jgi:hypothetical protein
MLQRDAGGFLSRCQNFSEAVLQGWATVCKIYTDPTGQTKSLASIVGQPRSKQPAAVPAVSLTDGTADCWDTVVFFVLD